MFVEHEAPRGKRFADPSGDSFRVVNKAPNGEAEPYFDRSRQVWAAPRRKPEPTTILVIEAVSPARASEITSRTRPNPLASSWQ